MSRAKELELKNKPLQDKSKKQLERIMELTEHNKQIQEKLRHLTKENEYLVRIWAFN